MSSTTDHTEAVGNGLLTVNTLPDDIRDLPAWLAAQWTYPADRQQGRRDSWPDPEMVSRTSFARLVTLHLRLSGFEPDQADLDNWLAAMWCRVVEDMSPSRWAEEYREAVQR